MFRYLGMAKKCVTIVNKEVENLLTGERFVWLRVETEFERIAVLSSEGQLSRVELSEFLEVFKEVR